MFLLCPYLVPHLWLHIVVSFMSTVLYFFNILSFILIYSFRFRFHQARSWDLPHHREIEYDLGETFGRELLESTNWGMQVCGSINYWWKVIGQTLALLMGLLMVVREWDLYMGRFVYISVLLFLLFVPRCNLVLFFFLAPSWSLYILLQVLYVLQHNIVTPGTLTPTSVFLRP